MNADTWKTIKPSVLLPSSLSCIGKNLSLWIFFSLNWYIHKIRKLEVAKQAAMPIIFYKHIFLIYGAEGVSIPLILFCPLWYQYCFPFFFVLDTEKLYTQIMHSICEPHGKEFTLEIKLKQMGKKEHESAKILIGKLYKRLMLRSCVKGKSRVYSLFSGYFLVWKKKKEHLDVV